MIAFVCGVVFAAGLALSGMLRPEKVIGFLDVFGRWDPSLAFVMGPAVGIYALAAWRRPRAPEKPLDVRLFAGAAIFGIGWGLTGICPGPAIVNLAAPNGYFLAFAVALVAGVALSLAARPRVR
ncbi:MAG TPA: DUF6691 family protein [Planctomycetota bacterium]